VAQKYAKMCFWPLGKLTTLPQTPQSAVEGTPLCDLTTLSAFGVSIKRGGTIL